MNRQDSRERRHERVALTLPVRVSSIDPETDPHTGLPCFRAMREVCANVSRGGAYIRTTDPLSPGRRVLLELELPDGASFETVGRIAWSRTVLSPSGSVECGSGVEFLGGNDNQREALGVLLARPPDGTR